MNTSELEATRSETLSDTCKPANALEGKQNKPKQQATKSVLLIRSAQPAPLRTSLTLSPPASSAVVLLRDIALFKQQLETTSAPSTDLHTPTTAPTMSSTRQAKRLKPSPDLDTTNTLAIQPPPTSPPAAPLPQPDSTSNDDFSDPTTDTADTDSVTEVLIHFQSVDGTLAGPQLSLPIAATTATLTQLINTLLSNDEPLPYSFYLNDDEITTALAATVQQQQLSTEAALTLVYQPQALFRVRAVTHCTSTLPGHTAPILTISYSASSRLFVTGSGDATLRLWDATTSTPLHTLKGHGNWVLCAAFAPNERLVASGSMDNTMRVWDVHTGALVGKVYKGHTRDVRCVAWEPLHVNTQCTRVASAGKDGSVRVWHLPTRACQLILSGHTGGVTCMRWGGQGRLYTGSQDRTVKVWSVSDGSLLSTLQGHAHWVNHLALSTDYALRLNGYNEKGVRAEADETYAAAALDRYNRALAVTGGKELLVSASEDFTCILWSPLSEPPAITRMTGHQQPVNYVAWSPDGRLIASGSFDKSVKVWRATDGAFVCTMRGHVGAVYQVCWSSDSRLLCSSSKDSTIKVWAVAGRGSGGEGGQDTAGKSKAKGAGKGGAKGRMAMELPGHADEVYACDWSANGEQVASGGKDHMVKVWRN